MKRAQPHLAGSMRTGTEFLTGLESWFTLPTQPAAPPPPYKMAILTWATIFPLITLVVVVSAPLLRSLPLVPKLAVTTLVTVALMTWVVMPRVTQAAARMAVSRPAAMTRDASRPGRPRPPHQAGQQEEQP